MYKVNRLDSDKVEKMISLSPDWIPAKICNYSLNSKYAVEIYTKPFLIDPTECCSDYYTMVYMQPIIWGGSKVWHQFLTNNLQFKIGMSDSDTSRFCKNAIVEFLVDKEGSLIKINILNYKDLHPLQIKEIDKIMLLPIKWIPGEMSGWKVDGNFIDVIHFEFVDIPIS